MAKDDIKPEIAVRDNLQAGSSSPYTDVNEGESHRLAGQGLPISRIFLWVITVLVSVAAGAALVVAFS